MTRFGRLLTRSFSLILYLGPVLAVGAEEAPASETPVPTVSFAGTEVFRYIIQDRGLTQPMSNLDEAWADPAHAVLIILGSTATTDEMQLTAEHLRHFVRNGGAVLLATDQRTSTEAEDAFGMRVTGSHLQALVPINAYRGNLDFRNCPLVAPSKRHALFRGVQTLASNVPSFLEPTTDTFPLGSFEDVANFALVMIADSGVILPNPSFARTLDLPRQGRVLLLSDQSVFINGMIVQTDCSNFEFAGNCIDWLSDSGRTNVLFFEDGKVKKDFDLPAPALPPGMLPDLPAPPVEVINKLLASWERSGIFDQLILSQIPLPRLLSTAAIILTIGFVLFGFFRLNYVRHRIEARNPLFPTSLQRHEPGVALVERRHGAMLASGNLWEAAHHLARQWFAAMDYLPAVTPAEDGEPIAAGPPQVLVNAGWWRHRQLRRQVHSLWRLAFSLTPTRVSRRQFTRLVSDLHDVDAALVDGTLQLGGSERVQA